MTTVERERVVEVVTEQERRARILEAAALEIEVRGWTDSYARPEGICLMEAIALAQGRPQFLWTSANDAWGLTGDDSRLWQWNDHDCDGGAEATFLLRWRAEEIRDGL